MITIVIRINRDQNSLLDSSWKLYLYTPGMEEQSHSNNCIAIPISIYISPFNIPLGNEQEIDMLFTNIANSQEFEGITYNLLSLL